MGAIYKLQDTYDYILPDTPPEEDILFHDKKKHLQFWEHPNFDFKEINEKWTDEKKIKFVERELNRRKNGCWFYNNGEPTYLTGSHYFFLVYFKVPVGNLGMTYPSFRKYQKEVFYFLDLMDKDKYCEGVAISKPRRVGLTAAISSDVMNLSMLRKDRIFSIQNKKLDEAQRFNYVPIRYNVDHFPSIKLSNGKEIFSPKISTGNVQNRRLTWGISMKDKQTMGEEELNTQIYIVPSVQNADDGGQAHRLIRDEVSKYDAKINISAMLSILRPVVKTGTEQVGKILFFCTSDISDSPNFEEWKKIYYDSDYTRRERKKTKTGLYKYFISAKYSLAGEVIDEDGNEVELFNDYGECDEEKAIAYLMRDRKEAKENGDLSALQRIKRNYPISEEDAFESGEGTACYDTARLVDQIHFVEEKEKRVLSGLEMPFYTKGRLVFEERDRKVKFETNKETDKERGHWTFYELPDERWRNKNTIDYYNFLSPESTSPYLVTVDPFAYRAEVEGGSQGAIIIGTTINSSLKDMGGKIIATYCHRPSNPNDFIEEVRKALIFCSAKSLVETNREWLSVDLIAGRDDESNNRPNYIKFMITYENGKFRQAVQSDKIAGFSSQTKSIEAYVKDTNVYLREPKDNEFDYLRTVMDKELLRQWKDFDPNATQKFDMAVAASLYCCIVKNFNRITQQNNSDLLSNGNIIRNWLRIKDQTTGYRKDSLIAP